MSNVTSQSNSVACVWCGTPRRDWHATVCNAPDGDGHLAFRNDRPTERERIEMCGDDPVRNEELGL